MFRGNEDDEARAIEFMQRVEWIDTRRVGRDRFIWRERIVRHGLPVGVVLVLINLFAGGTYGDYDPLRLALEGYFYFVGILILAYLCAWEEWNRREREHKERYGRRPSRQ